MQGLLNKDRRILMKEILIRKVELPNKETYGYRETGSGDKVILLVHGSLVSSRHWGPLLTAFGDKYRVIALDLRGAGQSTYNRPVRSFADWAYDVKLFCDELGLGIINLIGWSMGGGISQRFTASYPGYAGKLVLLESASCAGVPYHKKGLDGELLPECYDKREELLEDRIQLKPMIETLENGNRAYAKYIWDALVFNVSKPDEKEYWELIEDIFMTKNYKDAAWAAHNFNISHVHNGVVQGTGEVDKITIPVMVFAGERDTIVPPETSDFTAREIGSNARLVRLPNCGHAPHYDNLKLVADNIIEFFNE
jgi:pimeloyl-ACP methyl ester carboxylesterase